MSHYLHTHTLTHTHNTTLCTLLKTHNTLQCSALCTVYTVKDPLHSTVYTDTHFKTQHKPLQSTVYPVFKTLYNVQCVRVHGNIHLLLLYRRSPHKLCKDENPAAQAEHIRKAQQKQGTGFIHIVHGTVHTLDALNFSRAHCTGEGWKISRGNSAVQGGFIPS